jgi:5-hydroxyisourate hydrolase
MGARLTTQVIDTAHGRPAAQLHIDLFRLGHAGERTHLASSVTNAEGRTAAPLLEGERLTAATYELIFHVGAYFRRHGVSGDPLFLDIVPVRFGIARPDEAYHLPLLVGPWSYAICRAE